MKSRLGKEISLYFAYISFLNYPSLEQLEESLPKSKRHVLFSSFMAVHLAVWLVAFLVVESLKSSTFMQQAPVSTTSTLLILVVCVLVLITIGNLAWLWLMRATKLASEKSILRVIRYLK